MVGLRVKVKLGVQENGGSRPYKFMHLESKNKLMILRGGYWTYTVNHSCIG